MTDYKAIKLIKNGCEYCFPSGGASGCYIDLLVVAGGGSGGVYSGAGGGGGAGGVIYKENYKLECDTCQVVVGNGGTYVCMGLYGGPGCNGGNSCFGSLIACGGGGGAGCGVSFSAYFKGCDGGSGGGGYVTQACVGDYYGGSGVCGQGHSGGSGLYPSGGGGAGGPGCSPFCNCANTYNRGCCYNGGGWGVCYDIEGTTKCYAGGGGGYCQYGRDGGGNGSLSTGGCGCPGTTPGSGGGGAACPARIAGAGAKGIVVVRYPSDGSYGFSSATGGNCCYECNGYCIHKFTSDGTFTIVS